MIGSRIIQALADAKFWRRRKIAEAVSNDGVMAFRPGLTMRMWRALGFRYAAYAERPEDDTPYIVHRTFCYWDWRDRLRILLSGCTEIELCVETTVAEREARAIGTVRSNAVVLMPGTATRHVFGKRASYET